MGVQLSPEQSQALQAFAAKYPNFNYGSSVSNMGNALQANLSQPGASPQMFADFAKLQQQLAPAMQGAHFTPGGDIEKNMAWWKQALLAAGVVAAPGIAYAAMPAAAAAPAAGAGTDAMGLGPVAAAGGTTAATVPPALAGGGSGVLGALGRFGGIAGDIGRVASGAATGLANGRREDAAANGRAIAENNQAKVQAAQYNLKLPEVRTNQAARGEVLSTMQNAPLTGDPRIDKFSGGGLRPSAFGPQSRQAGAELSRQALVNLMDPSKDRLTPQEIPGTSGSTPENIAAGVGIGADIFSLLAKYGGR